MKIKTALGKVLGAILMATFMSPALADEALKGYQSQAAWKEIQTFLPEQLHLTNTFQPEERWWKWRGHNIHIDHFANQSAPALVILLHGVGTNGRQLSMIAGGPLYRHGFDVMALDLPGYGMTQVNPDETLTYSVWVELVSDFIDAQHAISERPVFLYGLSAGGMLAYHAAALNGEVDGIIGMTFLDQRNGMVRRKTARNTFISVTGSPLLWLADNPVTGGMKLPLKWVSKMNKLVNNDEALAVFLDDETSAGNWVSTRFLHSYLTYQPAIEPEDFHVCPILLTQPAEDHWTPIALSKPFLERLPEHGWSSVMLDNAGHYPLEMPGLQQLEESMVNFINQQLATGRHP
ncbi:MULTISPECIES: alpha/beta hydrolase [unclassified Alcanivorax]|uniref:alpha/beta hydrolase n=1 Tax=unclassified Alcanivorax TaxID=2638842 RepID=UPI000A70E084|nr:MULTISPECIES: alpha/beta hydrolase [unclassified Alcanivorax]